MSLPGVNEATIFKFFPVGDTLGDRYEACVMKVHCSFGGVCQPLVQMNFIRFLACFEGTHKSSMSFAGSCLTASGLGTENVDACYNDPAAREAAHTVLVEDSQLSASNLGCYPWILLENAVLSHDPKHGCFGENAATTPLLPPLCEAMGVKGESLPEACGAQTQLRKVKRA